MRDNAGVKEQCWYGRERGPKLNSDFCSANGKTVRSSSFSALEKARASFKEGSVCTSSGILSAAFEWLIAAAKGERDFSKSSTRCGAAREMA